MRRDVVHDLSLLPWAKVEWTMPLPQEPLAGCLTNDHSWRELFASCCIILLAAQCLHEITSDTMPMAKVHPPKFPDGRAGTSTQQGLMHLLSLIQVELGSSGVQPLP